jgi:hypothetical protein
VRSFSPTPQKRRGVPTPSHSARRSPTSRTFCILVAANYIGAPPLCNSLMRGWRRRDFSQTRTLHNKTRNLNVNENAFGVHFAALLLLAKTAMTSSKRRQKEALRPNSRAIANKRHWLRIKKRDRDIHVFASSDSLSYKFVPFASAQQSFTLVCMAFFSLFPRNAH